MISRLTQFAAAMLAALTTAAFADAARADSVQPVQYSGPRHGMEPPPPQTPTQGPVNQRGDEPRPAPPTRRSCTLTATAAVTLEPGQLVTIDYLRMHDPAFVAFMASQVRAGTLPPSALLGLASDEATDRVVGADWSRTLAAIAPPPPPTPGGPDTARLGQPNRMSPAQPGGQTGACPDTPTNNGRPGGGYDRAGGPAALDPATVGDAATTLTDLIDLDVSPGKIDLGTVAVGQRKRAMIRIVSMRAGSLGIAPSAGSHLRIVSVTANSGVVDLAAKGQPPAPSDIAPEPIIETPRAITLAAGQSADVVFEFLPTAAEGFNGSPTADQSTIDVTLSPTTPGGQAYRNALGPRNRGETRKSVPVSATVSGILYGIGLSLEQPLVYAHPGTTFKVFYDWYNNGVAGDAMVSVDPAKLPPGITLAGPSSYSIHLAAGDKEPGQTFEFNGLAQGQPIESAMTLNVKQTSSQGEQDTAYNVGVYLEDVAVVTNCDDVLPIPGKADIEYQCVATLASDGTWRVLMTIYAANGNCDSYTDATIIRIDPGLLYSRSEDFGNNDAAALTYFNEGVSSYLRNAFADISGKPQITHTATCHYHWPN